MLEQIKVKLKSRHMDTKESINYEVSFIVKKEKLEEIMKIFTDLLSFDHHDNSPIEVSLTDKEVKKLRSKLKQVNKYENKQRIKTIKQRRIRS